MKLKAQHPTYDELLSMPLEEQEDIMFSILIEIAQAIKRTECYAVLISAINENGRTISFAASADPESRAKLVADVEGSLAELRRLVH